MTYDACNPRLDGDNIIEHLHHLADVKDRLFRYFYWTSLCFRAIQRHIEKADDCVLIARDRPLKSKRAHSSISFRSAWRFSSNFSSGTEVRAKTYGLEFAVEFDETDEYPEITRTYQLQVPIDLELNFTQEKFDVWIAGLRKERDAAVQKEELAELARLKAKYEEPVKLTVRKVKRGKAQ